MGFGNLVIWKFGNFGARRHAGHHRGPSSLRLRNHQLPNYQITKLPNSSGYTFIELLVVTVLLLIIASAAMPLARVTVQRQREGELRRALREMRTAIDKYKDAVDAGLIGGTDVQVGSEGYPKDLDVLVEGVTPLNDATGRKLKFLRRIPVDPMTGTNEWGKRSYQDDADSTSWGGQNVYDVRSLSDGTALDGTKYRDW